MPKIGIHGSLLSPDLMNRSNFSLVPDWTDLLLGLMLDQTGLDWTGPWQHYSDSIKLVI